MQPVTVQATINAPLEMVWEYWTLPEHIPHWNSASDDWHTPTASNDLQVDGIFSYRMEAKDGSMGFDFGGRYTSVEPHTYIAYELGDGRKVSITFEDHGGMTQVIETFETEDQNPIEMQQKGWQAILDNFKKYVEASL